MYWTYPIYKNEYAVNVNELKKYMFCTDHKMVYNDPIIQKSENGSAQLKTPLEAPKEINILDKCKSRLTSVKKCQDPLFWSIYLAKFGKIQYDRLGLNGNEEMKEKMNMSQSFHKMGAAHLSSNILQKKITICGCSEMASNICTEKKLSWDSLNIVCACYDCNLFIVDLKSKTYFTYLRQNSDNYDTYVLYRTREKGPEYYIDTCEQLFTFDHLKNNFVWIMGYNKPFKSVVNYKIQELEQMAILLGLKTEGKIKKGDLYAKIALHCASI